MTRSDGREPRLEPEDRWGHDNAKHETNQRTAVDGSSAVGFDFPLRGRDEARCASRNAEGSGTASGPVPSLHRSLRDARRDWSHSSERHANQTVAHATRRVGSDRHHDWRDCNHAHRWTVWAGARSSRGWLARGIRRQRPLAFGADLNEVARRRLRVESGTCLARCRQGSLEVIGAEPPTDGSALVARGSR
jgi:hypothetical protein